MAVRKQRLDKYYNLAKEKGYRARSAFKLLELNRKYNFLHDTHIAVDLCAAPGGWMQILAQEMPSPRKIIGIDLDPIKYLGSDTLSFQGDITTVECRKTLIRHLEGHQVDIFVHDGAPNFGASKERDMFVQNDLVLHALKLATEFLKEGGVFVTKIFRNENFFKITKVLEELFMTVDVTKPLSSRQESAEIFAVCRHYKNPEEINPGHFNSEILFYDDQIETDLNKKILFSDFIKLKSNKMLSECAKVLVDFSNPLITEEFTEMFKDLKLINETDFKRIFKLKAKIIKGVIKGTFDIPVLDELIEVKDEVEKDTKIQTTDEKINEIHSKMEKRRKNKKIKSLSLITTARDGFFDDRIFEEFDSQECEPETTQEPEEVEEISEVTCSDSMDMTESEMKCAVMMKKMGDKFIESTIDKNIVDSDDIELGCDQRVAKLDEFNAVPKKIREYMGRKRTRAERRANKAMQEIEVENEEEEAVIYKKIYKNMYKKQTKNLRLIFPKKGKFIAPKGKGKLKLLDSRMKHDLRIERMKAKKR